MKQNVTVETISLKDYNRREHLAYIERQKAKLGAKEIAAIRAKSREAQMKELEEMEKKIGVDGWKEGQNKQVASFSGTTARNAYAAPTLKVNYK